MKVAFPRNQETTYPDYETTYPNYETTYPDYETTYPDTTFYETTFLDSTTAAPIIPGKKINDNH